MVADMRILAAALAGCGALVLAVALGAVMGGIAGEEPAGIQVAWAFAAAGAVILLVALVVEVVRRRGLRR
jgi:predicted MFS family arabinose efflux permease